MMYLIVTLLGFTVAGIVAGSIAALCMSCHGALTPAGGIVANFQRFGALGITAGYNVPALIIDGIVGCGIGVYYAIMILGSCPEFWS
jgi:hypothetical protein